MQANIIRKEDHIRKSKISK